MSCQRYRHTHKDNWPSWRLCLSLLCIALVAPLSCSSSRVAAALGYPSAQQEHDMLILDALSRRSGNGYYGENSVMEMLSRSTSPPP